ncbi:MAG TPA: hypothetical protein VGM37_06245 [Armatimonadota bacterium]
MQQTEVEPPATNRQRTRTTEGPAGSSASPEAPTVWERLDALEATLNAPPNAAPRTAAAPWKWSLAALLRAARFWKR